MRERTPRISSLCLTPSVKVLAYTYKGEVPMSPYTIPMLWNARCSITDQFLVPFKTENKKKTKKNINLLFPFPQLLCMQIYNNRKIISGWGGCRPWSHGGYGHGQSRTPYLRSPYDVVFPMRVSLMWGLDHGSRQGCLPHQKTFSMIWKGLGLAWRVCRRWRGQFKGTERSEKSEEETWSSRWEMLMGISQMFASWF